MITFFYKKINNFKNIIKYFIEKREKGCISQKRGCSVVEMECSALAAVAKMRNVVWGMILYTADSLGDADRYDERNWGGDSYEYALKLCLDSVLNL